MELFFFLLLFLEPSWTHPLAGRNGLLSVKITKTSMTCSSSLSMPLRCKGIAAYPHARPRRVAFGNY